MQPKQEVGTAQTGSTSFYALLRIVLIDPQLQPAQQQQLIHELRKNTPASDRWTCRWAIGLVVALTIVAVWMLSHYAKPVPDGLIAIGSGAAGSLAGLLAPGRDRDGHAQSASQAQSIVLLLSMMSPACRA